MTLSDLAKYLMKQSSWPCSG